MKCMTEVASENAHANLIGQVVLVAREAGRAIMSVYGKVGIGRVYKEDFSPVTLADSISHQVILKGLERLSPCLPVLSEESAAIPFDQRKMWSHFWMVDPLDGTKEFLDMNGEFTVNIALMENNAPILGVVYAPAYDKLYFAARGCGAFREHQGAISKVNVKRPVTSALRVVLSRSHALPGHDPVLTQGTAACEYILMGSSLKFCLIAEGTADVYSRCGPTMEWDTAAAHCILEEAGGSITDLNGNDITYNKPELLNPGFLAKVR